MSNIYVKNSNQAMEAVFNICKIYGVPIYLTTVGRFTTQFSIDDAIDDFKRWDYLSLVRDGVSAAHFGHAGANRPIAEFIAGVVAYGTAKSDKFKLNDAYDAEIQYNGDVKVGCQMFPAQLVLKLAEQVQKKVDSYK